MNKGLVTSFVAGKYQVYDFDKKAYFTGTARGKLKSQVIVKVGDKVTYNFANDNEIIIEDIEDRINDIIRPNICNIDQAFVIFSVKEPDLNLNLLDKFLVHLEYNEITPIIIFNKWDLLDDEKETLAIVKYYESIGYKCLITSAINGITANLKELIKGHISCFTGQSGVGKSSLLNILDPSLFLETNEISKALGRGKHTTRVVSLLEINDGWVADTPGFGTIDFTELDERSIADNFVDFFKLSSNCKYNGCIHINEPGCMVRLEVENGHILKSRYENYLSFINDLRKDKKNANSSFNTKSRKR